MSTPQKVNVGVIGCGNISSIYCKVMPQFDILNVYACADLYIERAHAKANEFQIPNVYTVRDLLADPQIDIVLNLTIPNAHAGVALAAIEARKSGYNQKPLATRRGDAWHLLTSAAEPKRFVGGPPAHFL